MTALYRAGKRLWSAENDAELVARYPHEPTAVIARETGRTLLAVYQRAQRVLHLHKSAKYLASPEACRLRRGDNVGAPYRFTKGHRPANKGVIRPPGWGPGRMKETQFTKGVRRGLALERYQPIGAERVSKEGYLERKVNDDLPFNRRWRFVHLLLWEATHGPIPKGHVVVFINGNRGEIRLDNLQMLTRAELMSRNTIHNLPKPLVSTIRLLGALNRRIRERKDHEKQDRRSA